MPKNKRQTVDDWMIKSCRWLSAFSQAKRLPHFFKCDSPFFFTSNPQRPPDTAIILSIKLCTSSSISIRTFRDLSLSLLQPAALRLLLVAVLQSVPAYTVRRDKRFLPPIFRYSNSRRYNRFCCRFALPLLSAYYLLPTRIGKMTTIFPKAYISLRLDGLDNFY